MTFRAEVKKQDLINKQFKKKPFLSKGHGIKSVDDFLDRIIKDWDKKTDLSYSDRDILISDQEILDYRFEQARYGEGYDFDDVDDFLDHIVVQWREFEKQYNEQFEEKEVLGVLSTIEEALDDTGDFENISTASLIKFNKKVSDELARRLEKESS